MYEKILEYFKDKPPVYSQSTVPFWDDEHISKSLLDAHLNPDLDGASRQHDFIRASVEWIAGFCPDKENKKLLDFGCGPGLYTELFHDAGFIVTGIDFSKRSIEYARTRAKDKNIEYNYQNYLTIEYNNEFDVITLIYCDFGVLSYTDRHTLLCKAKKALKKNGILILDGFTQHQLLESPERAEISYEDHGGFWSPFPYVCIRRNIHYPDTKNYLEQYVVVTKDTCNYYNMWNQIFDVETLSEELCNAGFNHINLFDDVSGKQLSNKSKTICAVAR